MSIHKLMRAGEAKICTVCDQAITDDDDLLITTLGRKLKVFLCPDCLLDFYRTHFETVEQASDRSGCVLDLIKPRVIQ